jgi:hypothetical protein
MLKLIVNGYINRNNIEFFKKDIGYWEAWWYYQPIGVFYKYLLFI